MGRIIYNPEEKKEAKELEAKELENDIVKKESIKISGKNCRAIGDIDCEYKIYVEDYVYTYLYQYAALDLTCEQSAVFLGKIYEETKEVMVWGIIPIERNKLNYENEWINKEVLEEIKVEKETYFEGADFIGWMHMQPGYGTMLTMKEIKAHQEVFGEEGKMLLLIDPINKIESFFVYGEEVFKEQSGYFMYYERNEAMQRYMLEHPLVSQQKEVIEDAVVNQFREIGRIRKKEYEERKKTSFSIVAAAVLILALSAVVVKMNDQGAKLKLLQNNIDTMATQKENSASEEKGVKVIIESPKVAEGEKKVETPATDLKVVDSTEVAKKQEPIKQEVAKKEEVAKEGETAKKEEPVKTDAVKVAEKEKVTEEKVDYETYVVKEGDTLLKISYDHYKTEEKAKDIIQFNKLDNGDKIFAGEKLKIPFIK